MRKGPGGVLNNGEEDKVPHVFSQISQIMIINIRMACKRNKWFSFYSLSRWKNNERSCRTSYFFFLFLFFFFFVSYPPPPPYSFIRDIHRNYLTGRDISKVDKPFSFRVTRAIDPRQLVHSIPLPSPLPYPTLPHPTLPHPIPFRKEHTLRRQIFINFFSSLLFSFLLYPFPFIFPPLRFSLNISDYVFNLST